MKVVHIITRIETIDDDIKELKKLEKSLQKEKSFAQAIYMSIEHQINILLDERIKLLNLTVNNPPETLKKEVEGDSSRGGQRQNKAAGGKKGTKKVSRRTSGKKAQSTEKKGESKTKIIVSSDDDEDDDFPPMLTQDQIDSKFDDLKAEAELEKKDEVIESEPLSEEDDTHIKILDIALEKGTLNKEEVNTKKTEKKVRFFRENFPSE